MQGDLYTPNIPVYIKEPIDNSINELFNTEKSVIPYAVRLPVYAKTNTASNVSFTTMTTPTF